MKTLLSLIMLTTLVAQLPQLQAAPSDFNSELIATLQRLLEIESDQKRLQEAEAQNGDGFYSTNCGNFLGGSSVVSELNDFWGSQFQVEFRCGHPTSSCTRVTDYMGASYQRYFELCDQGGRVCRHGNTAKIQIGSCNPMRLIPYGPYTIDNIPVGSKKASVDVTFTGVTYEFECIEVEFKGPKC